MAGRSPKKSTSGKFHSATISSVSAASGVGGVSWWIVIPLVIFFFGSGVYIGSIFVEQSSFHDKQRASPSLGLPGTYNIFQPWNSVSNKFKVRTEIETTHQYLRKAQLTDFNVDSPKSMELSPTLLELSNPENSFVAKNPGSSNLELPSLSGSVGKSILASAPSALSHPTHDMEVAFDFEDDKKFSLHATEHSFLTSSSNLDAENILIGAWIYLESSSAMDNDMRTVFSNKHPGCEKAVPQNGISLFVNAWQTNDHRVYLEYGGENSGCNKLESTFEVQSNRWYHVAGFFGTKLVALLVDGQVVATTDVSDPHIVQHQNPLIIGQYSSSAPYALFGNISQFAVVHPNSGDDVPIEELSAIAQDLMKTSSRAKEIPGIFAFYPLTDAAKEISQSKAKEIIHGYDGKYTFPLTGSEVAGVKVKLIDGTGGREVTDDMKIEADRLGRERREMIKNGMKFVWEGYRKYAWGRDELKPLSNHGQDNWGGMGVTLVDSLDTLWVMGLKNEFSEARDWVRDKLSFDHVGTVSVFETTIRELGGLLAAYDLSQDEIFLNKAKDLGDKLIKAFDTRSGIPTAMIGLARGNPSSGWAGSNAILSELGTLQVEFRYLSHHTGNLEYEKIAMKPLQLMAHKKSMSGLYPIKVRIDDGSFADTQVTFGALGDSFYEYLLKVWIQGGKKESWLRDMYDRAMDGAIDKLLMTSSPTGLAFLSDWNGRNNFRKMDHLVCFMPGLLALGAYTNPKGGLSSSRSQRDLAVAKALMYTCREMYHRTASGIAPEYVEFPEGRDMHPAGNANFYILRPETAESLFILNQLTGDPIYREWAWEIWEAIEKSCKAGSGYGSLRNVDNPGAGVDDRMESFFLAETMKYLYLAQDPDRPIDLMKYVFNTEAHPLSIFDDSHVAVSG